MKNLTTREFLKGLGAGGAALVGGRLFGDEAAAHEPLPPGKYIADPAYGTCRYIRDIPKFPTDVPSAFLRDGRVVQPARELTCFREVDVVVVGVCGEFMDRCAAAGKWVSRVDRHHGPYQPTIDPEAAKVMMDRMVRAERNLEVVFHCWGVDVVQDGAAVRGVVFESKQGRQAILAKRVVDCTGDGDVAFQAGADFRQITHNVGFVYRLGNVGRAKGKALADPAADGFPKVPNEPVPGAFWKNCLGPQTNGCSVEDLTKAEFQHRESMWRFVEKMRATPGYEETYVMNSCSQVGVRATRLVKTDYTLTMAEACAHKAFDDAIGMSGDDTFTRGAFQIPYRTLLPAGVENLLVAGRAMGFAPDLIDRVRLIPVCMVTGEAAGTAAAFSVASGVSPRALDVSALRRALAQNGACLA